MQRTVRELGGEIWAELEYRVGDECDWQVRNKIVELVMTVLARHENTVIINDADLPVKPLTKHDTLSNVA